MIRLIKRGQMFQVDGTFRGTRLRGSLGSASKEPAARIKSRLENAMIEGPASQTWRDLRTVLPKATYARFAAYSGVKAGTAPTWLDLETAFYKHLKQRVTSGQLSPRTEERYGAIVEKFADYLQGRRISDLHHVTKAVVADFKASRRDCLDTTVLRLLFAFAVEREMLDKVPVCAENKRRATPERGAEPFTAEELSKLREHAGDDTALFLLLRWTGLRGSDIVSLRWSEVDFDAGEMSHTAQKNGKRVVIPIHKELLACLHDLWDARAEYGEYSDPVALHPKTKLRMSRPVLYNRMVKLGERAGVPGVHPHRFRDTLAVDLLAKGASIYDVAKILGDCVATIERHYTPFVPALRNRVRTLLDNDKGMESR